MKFIHVTDAIIDNRIQYILSLLNQNYKDNSLIIKIINDTIYNLKSISESDYDTDPKNINKTVIKLFIVLNNLYCKNYSNACNILKYLQLEVMKPYSVGR